MGLAEGEGFEPPVGFPTVVFKTTSFVHSDIPPYGKIILQKPELFNPSLDFLFQTVQEVFDESRSFFADFPCFLGVELFLDEL